jgi:hypothetical protein
LTFNGLHGVTSQKIEFETQKKKMARPNLRSRNRSSAIMLGVEKEEEE